jgi:hypothetical protein
VNDEVKLEEAVLKNELEGIELGDFPDVIEFDKVAV